MKLILVRHGEIDSNLAKRYAGRSDEPLNATGLAQAHAAAAQLRGVQLAALLTSPLKRTRQTADIIAAEAGCAPQVNEAFNELKMGPWEGMTEDAVEARYPEAFALWNRLPADLKLKGRETLAELTERAVEGLEGLEQRHGQGCVAVVSHVAVIRVLMLRAAGRPLNDYKQITVHNARPITLALERGVLSAAS